MNFDKSFVQRIVQQEDLAFAQFYEQSVSIFFRYIKSHYTLSDVEIEDLLSEVYLKIWNNLDKYNSKYAFWQFVWAILKNHCKDYFKKSKSLWFSSFEYIHSDWSKSSLLDKYLQEDGVADLIDARFTSDLIQRSLSQFPQESQDLLYERYVLGYSYATLASYYGSSEEALRKKLSRLVKKLRILLERVSS